MSYSYRLLDNASKHVLRNVRRALEALQFLVRRQLLGDQQELFGEVVLVTLHSLPCDGPYHVVRNVVRTYEGIQISVAFQLVLNHRQLSGMPAAVETQRKEGRSKETPDE